MKAHNNNIAIPKSGKYAQIAAVDLVGLAAVKKNMLLIIAV